MPEFHTARRYLPSSPTDFLRELGHAGATLGLTVKLLVTRDVSATHRYGYHLQQMTYFKTAFMAHLAAKPSRIERWKKRQVFIDYMPDCESFKDLPEDTVGYRYYRIWKARAHEGLPDLRALRLRAVPEQAKALDLDRLARVDDLETLFRLIVARRDIFSTGGHDYRHLITGADTSVAGEVLVAKYEYTHLLEPGEWMNTINTVAFLGLTLKWRTVRKVLKLFDVIDRSKDATELDLDRLWERPVTAVRLDLGLPAEGLMPGGRLAAG